MKELQFKNIFFILLGAAIYSFGFVHFNIQNELGEGGFAGITLILYFLLNWDPALMNLILNIPLFFIGWKLLGKKVFLYTIIGTVAVSVFLKIFLVYEIQIDLQNDLFLVVCRGFCWSWARYYFPLWRYYWRSRYYCTFGAKICGMEHGENDVFV